MIGGIQSTKSTRIVINELTKYGTTLYDILWMEPKLKKKRDHALTWNMDKIECNMQKSIEDMITRAIHVKEEICHIKQMQQILHFKCEKYRIELKQSEGRLIILQNVKPMYTNQFGELQVHYHHLFSQYIKKIQNKVWLKSQI